MKIYTLTGIMLALAAVVFAVQNSMVVPVRFLAWEYERVSFPLIVILASLMGAFLSMMAGIWNQLFLRRRLREASRHIAELAHEMERLREAQKEKGDTQPLPRGN